MTRPIAKNKNSVVKWSESKARWYLEIIGVISEGHPATNGFTGYKKLERIGNIYENPELLKQ